jgi:hypothetical protein
MTQSETLKKPSSFPVSENVIIYFIAAFLLSLVMIVAFVGWQGQ